MKFAMGQQTLSTLGRQTTSAHDDLGALVRQLAAAAEPVYGSFNGAGRAAFDRFHDHTDEIATELDRALAAVLAGVRAQHDAFAQSDAQMADSVRTAQSGAATFSTSR